jgi:signal transduction histidine kinase
MLSLSSILGNRLKGANVRINQIRIISSLLLLIGIIGVFWLYHQIEESISDKQALVKQIHTNILQREIENLSREVKNFNTAINMTSFSAYTNEPNEGKIIFDQNLNVLYSSGPKLSTDSLGICLYENQKADGVYRCPITKRTVLYSFMNREVDNKKLKIFFFKSIDDSLAKEIESLTQHPVRFINPDSKPPELSGFGHDAKTLKDTAGKPLLTMVSYYPNNDVLWLGRLQFVAILIIALQAILLFITTSLGNLSQYIKQLRTKNALISKISKQREVLVKVLSHDLKNYITMIIGNVELAKLQIADDPALCKKLNRIQEAAELQTSLIDMIRRQVALDSGKLQINIQPVSLNEVLELTQNIFEQKLKEKEIKLDIDNKLNGTRILVDQNSFSANVINNLLSNAIKFSPENSTISISSKIESEKECQIIIEDQGIGIPPSMIDDIWKPDIKTTRPGTNGEAGTGFGLPLAKKFIEVYGGSISIKSQTQELSKSDHGTRVCIKIPASKN